MPLREMSALILSHALILRWPRPTRNPQYCSWLWAVPTLPPCPGEGGVSYVKPSAINMSPVAAQAKDIHLTFGDNRQVLVQGLIWVRVSTGQNPIMVPGGLASYSHQAIPNYLQSPLLPLFTVPTSLCFSFCSNSLPLTCSSWWLLGLLSVGSCQA